MESILLSLLEKGGPLGFMIAFIVIMFGVGAFLRQKGLLPASGKTATVDLDRLSSIDTKLGVVDRRLTDVEHDLRNRPTRRELHELDIAITKLDGRIDGIEKITTATNHMVWRIEQHFMGPDASSSKKG